MIWFAMFFLAMVLGATALSAYLVRWASLHAAVSEAADETTMGDWPAGDFHP